MIRRRISPWQILALVALVAWPSVSFGQALADRVPSDAIIYVGWRGADSLGPGYPNSNLKAVLDQSQIPQFIEEFLPKLADRLAQENPQATEPLNIVKTIAGPMWRHPSAFFFAGIDLTNPQLPVPHLGLISQAGNEGAAMQQQIEKLLQSAGNLPFPVKVIRSGDLVALLVGYANPETALAGGQGGARALATETNFTQALAQVGKDPVSIGYVNIEALVSMIDKGVQQVGPPEAQQMWPKIETALGIRGAKRAIFTQGFAGKEWETRAFLAAPEPREGLLAMLNDARPLSNEVYTAIPQNVRMAGAGRFDLAGFVSAIQNAATQFDPNAGQMIDGVFQQISQTVGVDVRKDLLGSLGDEWAYYIDPTVMGRSMLGATVVNRLKNPAKAEESITKIQQFVTNLVTQQLADKHMTLSVMETRSGGVTIHYLGVPLVAPSWAIDNGNLYIGLYPQVVAAAASHGATKGKSILDNKDFVAIRARVGGEKAGSFQFMDLPHLVPDSYGSWIAITRLSGFGDILGIPAPPMLLPALDKIMPYFSPAMAVSSVDAQGLHLHAIEPFPASDVLATDPMSMGAAQPAVMMSILLPALNKAREQANRVKSASNLRQIGLAGLMYANAQNGKFPQDLGALFETQDLSPVVFVNPSTKTELPPDFGNLTKPQQKKWIDDNSDYMWLGAGKSSTGGADVVIACEKPEGSTVGLNMLFADGHVDFVAPMPEAMQRIQAAESGKTRRSDAARSSRNRPPARSSR